MFTWNSKYSSFTNEQILKKLSINIIERLATTQPVRADYLCRLVRDGDIHTLCEYTLDYANLTPYESSLIRQVLALYSKNTSFGSAIESRARAKEKFIECESKCRESNDFFRRLGDGSVVMLPDDNSVFYRAQQKISKVLGEVPKLSDLTLRFGPGSTSSIKKRHASIYNKLEQTLTCSDNFSACVSELLYEMPALASAHSLWEYSDDTSDYFGGISVNLERDIIEFVPKSRLIDRPISKGPLLNLMIQLGVGDYISDRLRTVAGVDLHDQSKNQQLAQFGSITGSFATIDLASASDTISRGVVIDLLPPDWVSLLDTIRVHTYRLDEDVHVYEKFSGMGNGFTFPLESLIFWALASSASDDDIVSVYGDDIIVKTEHACNVTRILQIAGFSLNTTKTFITGPFRESCGGDYHSGVDIRPCYVKEALRLRDVFRLHNFFVKTGDQDLSNICLWFIPYDVRIWGPALYGDGHLHSLSFNAIRKSKHIKDGYAGSVFKTYTDKGLYHKVPESGPGSTALPAYSIYRSSRTGIDLIGSESYTPFQLATYLRFSRIVKDITIIAPGATQETAGQRVCAVPGTGGVKTINIYCFD